MEVAGPFDDIYQMFEFDFRSYQQFSSKEIILENRVKNVEFIYDLFAGKLHQVALAMRQIMVIKTRMAEDLRRMNFYNPASRMNIEMRLNVLESVKCIYEKYVMQMMTALEIDYKISIRQGGEGNFAISPFRWRNVILRLDRSDLDLVFPLLRYFQLAPSAATLRELLFPLLSYFRPTERPGPPIRIANELWQADGLWQTSDQIRTRHFELARNFCVYHPYFGIDYRTAEPTTRIRQAIESSDSADDSADEGSEDVGST